MRKRYLITGVAGFIGYYLSKRLLDMGHLILGVDNLNGYYDISLKEYRLKKLERSEGFSFSKLDISNKLELEKIFINKKIDYVINLAAQAGVRYSMENPDSYIKSNVIGFYNLLELIKKYEIKNFIYASSSSVYGLNKKSPFNENDFVDKPVSLYAATKKTNELFAYTYSHLYNIQTIGLRFFTVYGPLGRPDMAYFKFLNKYFNNETIEIYNNNDLDNDLLRDFTYIDDVIESIIRLLEKNSINNTKYQIINIGNSRPIKLSSFVSILEESLSYSMGKKIIFDKFYLPIKPGDVTKTYASTSKLGNLIQFKPQTRFKDGIRKFTDWYVEYYKKGQKK